MIEWVIVAWLINCKFTCPIDEIPKWKPFNTKVECVLKLKDWIGDPHKPVYEGYYIMQKYRAGECQPRHVR